jgi:hypothetical protein
LKSGLFINFLDNFLAPGSGSGSRRGNQCGSGSKKQWILEYGRLVSYPVPDLLLKLNKEEKFLFFFFLCMDEVFLN